MKTAERVHELFLNYACSAKCAFCYNPPITQELLFRETSMPQAVESLYLAARRGCTRLNLHGGEVTLRDDLPGILATARRLGYRHINIVTNGVRLAESGYAKELVACGANEFRFSLHAATPELHDRIVRLPGAFNKALAGIRNLRREGVAAIGVNYVLHRDNAADLPRALELYFTNLGLRDFIVYYPHYRGMAELNAEAIAIPYPEAALHVREAFRVLKKIRAEKLLYLANFPPCVLPERRGQILDWSHEDARGDALNIPEGPTRAIGEMKHEQRTKHAGCSRCSLNAACSGFEREYARLYGGDHFIPVFP